MTKNIFYNIFRPLAWLFGCYPARAQKGNTLYGVDGSVQLLDANTSVLIFPQGKCVKPGRPDVPAHSGVIRIHHARPRVPILLCCVTYHGFHGLWQGRIFTVTFNKARHAEYKEPDELMKEIFSMSTSSRLSAT